MKKNASVGLLREVKDGERRVALAPDAVAALVERGVEVRVVAGAGREAGFHDDTYRQAGARIVEDPADAWGCDVVVKVKEPIPREHTYFRPDLTLFSYLHLAAAPELAQALINARVTAVAFETVTDGDGLPLLAPMSEIAGRAAAIVGAFYLGRASGTMLGGAQGVPPARVIVVGMGVAGTMAARGARGMDAEVTGIDVDLARLRECHQHGMVTATLASSPSSVAEAAAGADLIIGAALIPGDRAPVVLRKEHIAVMKPGAAVVDLAIDQGGCIETARPTTHSDPVYEVDGVLHYCVTNVPAHYPRTASRALSATVGPRVLRLLEDPDHPALAGGLNLRAGQVMHEAVARGLGAADMLKEAMCSTT